MVILRSSVTITALLGLVSSSKQTPIGFRIGGSKGCNTDPNTLKHQSINSSGGTRRFWVDLPSGYNKNTSSPLIVSYHGHGSDSNQQRSSDQLSDATFNKDLQAIVVYPNGTASPDDGESSWQGAPYANKSVSDLDFTSDLLDYMRNNYCIDNTRIYAAGKSNGAGFVDTLACAPVGGNFAAFAMASAALYSEVLGPYNGSLCVPASKPAPILETHGTADDTIDPTGVKPSHKVKLPSISSWLVDWASRDGCTPDAINTTSTGLIHTTFNCNGNKDLIHGYLISGLGHVWPHPSNNDAGFEGTSTVIDFFKAHPKA